jgi:catechol 2,3-dioxygenase-like lactoylglutathione lyase family enzyme
MEALVARLLNAFEQGRIDRRQLIQSIAVAATGAHALASAAPAEAATVAAAPAAAAFKTVGLDHISMAVTDYKRTRDFYADLMGWQIMSDDGERQVSMRTGNAGQIIIRNARQPVNLPGGEGRPPVRSVINHISWAIENFDTDRVKAELERRGHTPRRDQGGGQGTYDSYHILDPDGWDLQISNRAT